MKRDISDLHKKLGYTFKDISLLNNALTHKSYTQHMFSNERLEFLGDAVLQLSISQYLYKNYSKMPEGEMAKVRASLVCKQTLYEIAKKIGLGEYILMSKNEMANGGRKKPSILSDATEAVFAAIYLDSSYDTCENVIINIFSDLFEAHVNGQGYIDYKTKLQEYAQRDKDTQMSYELVKSSGRPHDMTFEIVVSYNGDIIGKGIGKSKKEAEQNAAKYALDKVFKLGR